MAILSEALRTARSITKAEYRARALSYIPDRFLMDRDFYDAGLDTGG